MHAFLKLGMFLFEVENVEFVGFLGFGVGDPEVEPLGAAARVTVNFHQQVIFVVSLFSVSYGAKCKLFLILSICF